MLESAFRSLLPRENNCFQQYYVASTVTGLQIFYLFAEKSEDAETMHHCVNYFKRNGKNQELEI